MIKLWDRTIWEDKHERIDFRTLGGPYLLLPIKYHIIINTCVNLKYQNGPIQHYYEYTLQCDSIPQICLQLLPNEYTIQYDGWVKLLNTITSIHWHNSQYVPNKQKDRIDMVLLRTQTPSLPLANNMLQTPTRQDRWGSCWYHKLLVECFHLS